MTGLIKMFHRFVAAFSYRTARLLNKVADEAFRLAEPDLDPEHRTLLSRNRELRNRHQDRRCFIVANGASVQKQDLSPLGNEITIVMNAFWKHPVVAEWQPTYYCFSDPVLFDGSEPMSEFFASLRERIHSTNFIVPLAGRATMEGKGLLPAKDVYFVEYHHRALGVRAQDEIEFSQRLPWFYTTAQLALMLAIYLGCSPIYLLGFDHDWLVFREYERHFYEGKTVSNHPVAHGEYVNPLDVDIESVLSLWKGYRQLDAICKARGIQILNATDGGLLDVFDRVPYESLIAGENPLKLQAAR